jgi:hypothetical protein
MKFTVNLFTVEFQMPSLLEPAVTNARFVSLHGLSVAPFPLSTTPVPLLKPRARHERNLHSAAGAAGFRLWLGGERCASAVFRYALLFAFRSTVLAHRPQTEAKTTRIRGQSDEFVNQ